MSLIDDQAAELDAQLDVAWQKCLYGRTYSPAYEMARRIKLIRFILSKKEEGDASPNLNWSERRLTIQTAGLLLIGAITSSKKLREVADALDAEKGEDPRQANILKAYEDCIQGRYPPTVVERGDCFVRCSVPTLAQLRDAFIKRFGEKSWPSRFGVEKALRKFGLLLRKSKRGRPVGSRSLIRNPKY
jgi:hypothetical protein